MWSHKTAYICGPLTELPVDLQEMVKTFYSKLAYICAKILDGKRAFVPHEHYDPIKHRDYTPAQVDAAERKQVCQNTSLLVVVPIAPSWGGGIEVEMAYRSDVPVILLCEKNKLEERRISRLLRGNPAITHTIIYTDFDDALTQFEVWLRPNWSKYN